MKLHLGCGSVYLRGYVNIDTPRNARARLAVAHPELVAQWETTEDEYYAKQPPLDLLATRNLEFVADTLCDICSLPIGDACVEHILVVQTFEHLTRDQVNAALSDWFRVLKPGGTLQIDVPDIEKSIQLFLDADSREGREAVARLIFGSRKSALFYHHFGYAPEGLQGLLGQFGFHSFERLPSFHDYPAFVLRGQK